MTFSTLLIAVFIVVTGVPDFQDPYFGATAQQLHRCQCPITTPMLSSNDIVIYPKSTRYIPHTDDDKIILTGAVR